ncbi:hypothetical protein [Paraburkholderia sp. 22B1P]|uniref:hypothetical protein n=1 Tax=Paraburkholderia sp. 22B1P TaxID=3080498 RepID=UPI003087B771|nr:hypothetical protein PBP221_17420 [Paraburkholderia sp. 22B1P]
MLLYYSLITLVIFCVGFSAGFLFGVLWRSPRALPPSAVPVFDYRYEHEADGMYPRFES